MAQFIKVKISEISKQTGYYQTTDFRLKIQAILKRLSKNGNYLCICNRVMEIKI